MIYTIAKIREYTRGLDERMQDTDKVSDNALDAIIEEGIATAQDIKPIFYTKEQYDLTTDMTVSLLPAVEIILQEEPHSVHSVDCDLQFFDVEITANNHVILTKKLNAALPVNYLVTVRYAYYPLMPIVTLEMSLEMYKLVKRGIAIAVFASLSDEANEKYHQEKAEQLVIKSTFDIEKDMDKIPTTRLWGGTWV